MLLPLALLVSLAQTCAPSVAPATLLSVVRTESGFDPLTIGVNGRPHQAFHPPTPKAAERLATMLLARGRNLDLGLTQINARNLPRLGLSIRAAFDPCQNLTGAAQILAGDYIAAQRTSREAQPALRAALSAYNTGDAVRGLLNGYVAKVQASAAVVVPAIEALQGPSGASAFRPAAEPRPALADEAEVAAASSPVSLDVFARGEPDSLVWPSAPLAPLGRARRKSALTSKLGDPA